jgi:hypothetical protein
VASWFNFFGPYKHVAKGVRRHHGSRVEPVQPQDSRIVVSMSKAT